MNVIQYEIDVLECILSNGGYDPHAMQQETERVLQCVLSEEI